MSDMWPPPCEETDYCVDEGNACGRCARCRLWSELCLAVPGYRQHRRWVPPVWWQAIANEEHVRDSPILHACANAGMTAEQALVEMAKAHTEMHKRMVRMLEHAPTSYIVDVGKLVTP